MFPIVHFFPSVSVSCLFEDKKGRGGLDAAVTLWHVALICASSAEHKFIGGWDI